MKCRAIIFLLFAPLFPPAAFGQSGVCGAPEVSIKTQVPETTYIYDKNMTAIQLMLRESGRMYAGFSDDWVLSVTLAKPMFTLEGDAEGGCANAVRVVFGYAGMAVHIASDFKPGTCAFKTLSDHEYEHVTINIHTLEDYAKGLTAALAELRPAASSGDALKPYRDKMEQAAADFEKRLRNRELILDTPQSYDRMIAKCEDWNQSYTWTRKTPVQRAPAQAESPKPPKRPVQRAPSAPMP